MKKSMDVQAAPGLARERYALLRVPVGMSTLERIRRYEKDVLAQRG